MQSGDGLKMFEQRMLKKLESKAQLAGFDPMIIIGIILGIIMPLIQECLFKSAKRLKRKGLNKPIITSALHFREGMTWEDAEEYANYTTDVAIESKDEEIQRFIDDCCGD